jgi:putative endonuclease
MTNKSGTLYTGVTNNLERRIFEHKHHLVNGFTQKYKIGRLVYFEETNDINAAISREKQIKGWLRKKKLALIKSMNPSGRTYRNNFWRFFAALWRLKMTRN